MPKDKKTKNNKKNKLSTKIFVKMACALSRIINDMESEEENISNKEEVLGEIRDDLFTIYCNYKLTKK